MLESELPENVRVCGAPDGALDLQAVVSEAEHIFAHICPGEVFYPPEEKVRDVCSLEPAQA